MKKMKILEILKKKKIAAGCVAAALALVVGSVAMVQESARIPELPSYTDPVLEVSIEDEETPLAAAPKVTSKTTKKTTKKNVKLKAAATKTYTKKLPTVKKTTSSTQNKTNETVKTQTTVLTDTSEKYTKKSKVKAVTTTVTTTVVTTTTAKTTSSAANSATVSSGTKSGKYEVAVSSLAPMMDSRVISAYNKLGFKVVVDSSVAYAGHFDARTRTITMQGEDNTIYHELGHFLAFISGNSDQTSSFLSIYNLEKSKFTGANKSYATQNSAEYFAESVKDYVVQPAVLKSTRPQTYQAITEALNKMTDAQVTKVQTLYAPVWK